MRLLLIAVVLVLGCRHAPPAEECATDVVERHAYVEAELACAQGKLEACLVQADMLAQGITQPRDPAAAQALRERACDGGVGPGCARDTGLVAGAPATPVDLAPAEAPTRGATFTPVHLHPDLTPGLESPADQARFTPAGAAVLDAVAATLAAHPELSSLLLEGQASSDEHAPGALALARAEAAKAELVRRRVAPGRLVVRGAETATATRGGVTFRAPCPEGMAFTGGGAFTSLQGPQQLAPFCLDLTEFTVAAYQRCVDAGACSAPDAFELHGRWNQQALCNWKHPEGRAGHPINCVTWPQAEAGCAFAGKRLPSDGELEWAMRNGPAATAYPWGSQAPGAEHANGCGAECPANLKAKAALVVQPLHRGDDGFPETAPVGHFAAGDNSWGVHDLSGNVEEWTQTLFGAQGVRRHRGGSFMTTQPDFFSTQPSDGDHPLTHSPALGFRCATSPH